MVIYDIMIILELKNISKKYQMGKVFVPAINNISFTIEKGQFAAISGPSGSGKSTLLNMIGLVDLPTTGKIIIEGNDVYGNETLPEGNTIPRLIDKKLTKMRSKHLAFIFQNFNLIPVLNITENVELPLNLMDKKDNRLKMSVQQRRQWVDYLIERVGLTAWKTHKPSELSGGQRQRVAIARALVTKAPIVLADEPTANLDSKNGEQILETMNMLNKEFNTTFIFSTHDTRIVNMCNHVIYIMDGNQVDETFKQA